MKTVARTMTPPRTPRGCVRNHTPHQRLIGEENRSHGAVLIRISAILARARRSPTSFVSLNAAQAYLVIQTVSSIQNG